MLFVCLFLVLGDSAEARLLEGALQQSEALPALSDQFKVGGAFSDEMLGHDENLEEWVMIPPSMAGTWSRNGATLLTVFDEQTKKSSTPNTQIHSQGSYVRGFQVDANGNIWDCPRARRQRFETADQGRIKGYIIITGRRQMLVTGPNSLRDYGEVTLVDVEVATGTIKRVERNEQVVERKVVQDGVIIADGRKRTFTAQGKLLTSSTDRSEERLTASFTPVDTFNGLDLRASFQRFLQANASVQTAPGGAQSGIK